MRVLSPSSGIFSGIAAVALPPHRRDAALSWIAWRHGAVAQLADALRVARALTPPVADGAAHAWRLCFGVAGVALRAGGTEVAWRPLYPADAWVHYNFKAQRLA